MGIATLIAKSGPYSGNGVTTVFDYDFKIYSDDHLQVIITDADGIEGDPLELDTDYSVSGVGVDAGGTITYPLSGSPLATGTKLTIKRVTPKLQGNQFTNSGGYVGANHQRALDLIVQMIQDVSEEVGRAVKVDLSSATDPDDLLDQLDADVVAAAASAAASLASQLAAAVSAAAALVSEANAAASAATALAATIGKYDAHIDIAFADSPYTVASLTEDTLITVNTSGGNVVINLPVSTGEDDGRLLGINKNGATNTITVNRAGADTIGGATSFAQYDDTEWADFYLDKSAANWQLGNLSFTAAGDGLTKTGSTISLDRTDGGSWTGPQRGTPVVDNDGAFDLTARNNFEWTPTGSDTLEFTGEASAAGQTGVVKLFNPSGYTISLGAECVAPDNMAADLSAAGNYIIGYYVNADGATVDVFFSGPHS